MVMSLLLFENEFLNIVAISFTALILNELLMVALEITTWSVVTEMRSSTQLTAISVGTYTWSRQRLLHCFSTLSAWHFYQNTLVRRGSII